MINYSADELRTLAFAVEKFGEIVNELSTIEAWPRDWIMSLDTEIQPGYLGHIGIADGGEAAFYPHLAKESP